MVEMADWETPEQKEVRQLLEKKMYGDICKKADDNMKKMPVIQELQKTQMQGGYVDWEYEKGNIAYDGKDPAEWDGHMGMSLTYEIADKHMPDPWGMLIWAAIVMIFGVMVGIALKDGEITGAIAVGMEMCKVVILLQILMTLKKIEVIESVQMHNGKWSQMAQTQATIGVCKLQKIDSDHR